jgi:hypothetical protein
MTELPLLAIELITFKRTDMARRTVDSTCLNLGYPRDRRGWYVADDGSPVEHINAIVNRLVNAGEVIIGFHNERLRHAGQENTYFAGYGWNRGLGLAHQWSDYVLTLEDDWELQKPLDITRYIGTLRDHEDVGLIRLGTLAVGNTVDIVGYDGVHYLKYSREQAYAYSGNPNIRHARFTRAYGNYAEDKNPGEIELAMDWNFRQNPGPDIIRPAEINPWGAFGHIGTDKSYE